MARIVGRRVGLWALGLLGLVGLAPLAVFAPLAGAFALAAAACGTALLSHRRATQLAARSDKLSGEVDVLSRRLLRLEAIGDAESSASRPDAGRPPDTAAIAAGVEEVTAEIGLLSGIVRELAAVVSAQDGEIAGLKAQPRPVAPVPAPVARVEAPEIVVGPRRSEPAPVAWTPRALDAAPLVEAPRPERAREAALIAAFDGEGLEVHLQPVVSLAAAQDRVLRGPGAAQT